MMWGQFAPRNAAGRLDLSVTIPEGRPTNVPRFAIAPTVRSLPLDAFPLARIIRRFPPDS
ncbi:hypothetical protein GCM10025867_18450 [Frondihabitans sucicola]|uniref:Uncharacterized protein n=1 Tax=Frondihabitans sucicola TaxID=1268041 RepID=A0ABN6XX58_9MICO|nr:hypothetical protein GCM10025867_18450 [Frondihabitans sucicola]